MPINGHRTIDTIYQQGVYSLYEYVTSQTDKPINISKITNETKIFEFELNKNVPINLLNCYYDNIKDLKYYENYYDLYKYEALGYYQRHDNRIVIIDNVIFHELLHTAFNTKFLCEGYTEFLNHKFFNKYCHNSYNSYQHETMICSILEEIIGEQKMIEYFFTNNVDGLVRDLSNLYGTKEEAKNFIKNLDYCKYNNYDNKKCSDKLLKIQENLVNYYYMSQFKKTYNEQTNCFILKQSTINNIIQIDSNSNINDLIFTSLKNIQNKYCNDGISTKIINDINYEYRYKKDDAKIDDLYKYYKDYLNDEIPKDYIEKIIHPHKYYDDKKASIIKIMNELIGEKRVIKYYYTNNISGLMDELYLYGVCSNKIYANNLIDNLNCVINKDNKDEDYEESLRDIQVSLLNCYFRKTLFNYYFNNLQNERIQIVLKDSIIQELYSLTSDNKSCDSKIYSSSDYYIKENTKNYIINNFGEKYDIKIIDDNEYDEIYNKYYNNQKLKDFYNYYKNNNIGFEDYQNNIGYGITKAYIAKSIYPNREDYKIESTIINVLNATIGEKRLKDYFINNDLDGLANSLASICGTLDEAYNFIKEIDIYTNQKINMTHNYIQQSINIQQLNNIQKSLYHYYYMNSLKNSNNNSSKNVYITDNMINELDGILDKNLGGLYYNYEYREKEEESIKKLGYNICLLNCDNLKLRYKTPQETIETLKSNNLNERQKLHQINK